MQVEFVSVAKFFSNRGRTKTSKKKLCELKFPNTVSPKSIENWEGALILPDALPNSSFEMCKIINFSYYLEFKFGISGPSVNKNLMIPIVIGTIKFDTNNVVKETF